jgi:hypothetical protein
MHRLRRWVVALRRRWVGTHSGGGYAEAPAWRTVERTTAERVL